MLATSCALALSLVALTSAAAPPSKPIPRRAAPKKPPQKIALVAPAPVAAPAPAPAPAPALAPALAPPPAPAPDADLPASPSSPSLHHRATVTLNPLGLAIGRYGANAEYLFAPHHGVIASGYLQTFPRAILRTLLPDVALGDGPQSRLGGEIGYRLYSGADDPTGVFIGPSLVAMPLAAPQLTGDYRVEVTSFMAYGAALDIGVQAVVGAGFTIGGGVGVTALAYSRPASAAPPAGIELPSYPEPHVLPRLLFAAGWAF
ncbi:MAG: hypothetical protein JWP87_3261 [Labilithrix sp.]|nr:hypothetical protein [Labilithrix sp.]